ncbi:Uncharacterised protein [Serratia ficaria]|uniref:hypothetical protein n=1 Tax=Serratia ficaria TaxID=61651 RepID=UPI0021C4EB82|nr:hypothetical protein [Serratia ficaria]CAI2786452.1 Uncharacterised protein [Serratia ficaria]
MTTIEMIKNLALRSGVVASADVLAVFAELEATEKRLHEVATACATAEQRIAELEAIRADASQVFKEIGSELGCNPDNESIMMAIDELKKRLATPVRLPAASRGKLNDGLTRLSIKRAGFTFTVEGDEQ